MELSSFANMLKENEISIIIVEKILNICLIGFLVDYLISNLTCIKIWGILQECGRLFGGSFRIVFWLRSFIIKKIIKEEKLCPPVKSNIDGSCREEL